MLGMLNLFGKPPTLPQVDGAKASSASERDIRMPARSSVQRMPQCRRYPVQSSTSLMG
ncbi:hypothetical protein NOVOSPHI9U_10624 [Novosphingobium sp. 9U]|nr:hypothetical protein NOVOSPHI9U_10624 [Novosphingobium sp. 9U]